MTVFGQVPVRRKRAGPLIAATDASLTQNCRLMGAGWLCTDGRWGMAFHSVPRRFPRKMDSDLCELAAAGLMLRRCEDGGFPDLVVLDNLNAVRWLQAWQAGSRGTPAGAEVIVPGMAVAGVPETMRLCRRAQGVRFEHVYGHRGHVLNEAADMLAKIAREVETAHDEVFARGARLVGGFLESWHAQTG